MDPLNQIPQQFRCGQCLPCRINKTSAWSLRLLLEQSQSTSASFWTLTLDDDNIGAAYENNRRRTLRRFWQALRKYESRHGNTTMIRYFGCLEFGGQFGRPHWHFLIFNLSACYQTPQIYLRGLPRLMQHITQWPHGHVDIAQFNHSTIHYVVQYLTDFHYLKIQNQDLQPIQYSTRRPAIGYYGLKHYAKVHAKQVSCISEKTNRIQIGNRTYPMDQWTRNTFHKLYLHYGGKYSVIGSPKSRKALKDEEDELILKATPAYVIKRQETKERLRYEFKHIKAQKKEAREQAISARYEAIQAQKLARSTKNNN